MPIPRAARRLCRLGTALPLMGAGLIAWRPARAQGAASGQMAVRVTVLEPVQPMTLTSGARPPRLAHDPATGATLLFVGLTTDAAITTHVGDAGAPAHAELVHDPALAGDPGALAWRVTLPVNGRWRSDSLEVRFTTRTGEAETTAIACVSRAALRAIVATNRAADFRRDEPGLF